MIVNVSCPLDFGRHPITTSRCLASRRVALSPRACALPQIFGLLSVLSFVYRYFFVLPRFGHLGFSVLDEEAGDIPSWWPSWFNHATVWAHVMLSCSSFIFHVLPFRIKTKPLVIYEEYRAHACLFTLRWVSSFLSSLRS